MEGYSRVRDCEFEDNEASKGGGLYASSASSGGATIRASSFTRNRASNLGGGLGLDTSVALFDCVIKRNLAGTGAGQYGGSNSFGSIYCGNYPDQVNGDVEGDSYIGPTCPDECNGDLDRNGSPVKMRSNHDGETALA